MRLFAQFRSQGAITLLGNPKTVLQRVREGVSSEHKIVGISDGAPSAFDEKHYAPAELGELWNVSADTVRRMFYDQPGVKFFGEVKPGTRRHLTMRIPASVAEAVYKSLSGRKH